MPERARRAVAAAALALLAGLLPGGCAQPYRTFEPAPLEIPGPPIDLAVDEVIVRSAYLAPESPPFVEHGFALTPNAAARQLLEQRLRAVGGAGALQATILDASVQERALATQGGLTGALTEEASALLIGRLKVQIERLDAAGNRAGSISTAVSRTRGIPEDASFPDRQEIGHGMVRDLVSDLNTGLTANLGEHFGDLIVP